MNTFDSNGYTDRSQMFRDARDWLIDRLADRSCETATFIVGSTHLIFYRYRFAEYLSLLENLLQDCDPPGHDGHTPADLPVTSPSPKNFSGKIMTPQAPLEKTETIGGSASLEELVQNSIQYLDIALDVQYEERDSNARLIKSTSKRNAKVNESIRQLKRMKALLLDVQKALHPDNDDAVCRALVARALMEFTKQD